jgi:predicted ferric reductase
MLSQNNKKTIAYLILILNLSLIVFGWFNSGGSKILSLSSPQALSLMISRLAGLLAMLSMLVQLVLIARTNFLEDAFGLNKLIKAHKWFGIATFSLVLVHVGSFIGSLYYGSISEALSSYQKAVLTWDDLIKAFIAFWMLIAVIFTSALLKLKAMQYRYWYLTHFLTYGIVILAIGHQINLGPTLQNTITKAYWVGIFLLTLSLVLYCRFLRPYLKFRKFQFQVDSILPNNQDTFSFILTFKYPHELKIKPGQFAKFMFFQKGLWQEMHPFSFSAVGKNQLRVTVKNSGPYTAKLKAKLKAGTKVLIDGPYGKFTADAAKKPQVLFIAGGVGITPIVVVAKKMLDLDKNRDVKLMYFAGTKSDLIFRQELEKLFKNDAVKFYASDEGDGFCDQQKITDFAPDVKNRSVYLCGPPPMMKAVKKQLKSLKLNKKDVISEEFGF